MSPSVTKGYIHRVITRHLRHLFEPNRKICIGREVVQVGILTVELHPHRRRDPLRGVVAKQVVGARQIVLIEHLHGANRMS